MEGAEVTIPVISETDVIMVTATGIRTMDPEVKYNTIAIGVTIVTTVVTGTTDLSPQTEGITTPIKIEATTIIEMIPRTARLKLSRSKIVFCS